jgi:hypothetical protein
LSWLTCQANLPRLTCLGCPVQHHSHVSDVKPHFTVMGVLPRLSHLNCPAPPALFLLSCSGHPVLSFFFLPASSRLSSPAVQSQLSCHSILVPRTFAPLSFLFMFSLSYPI